MSQITPETPLEHRSHHGTVFVAKRADLQGGVVFEHAPESGAARMSDVAEFTAFHALRILPHLNGFQGYDCIRFLPGESA